MARYAGLPWDCIVSAELFGHYKPDPEVYLGLALACSSARPGGLMLVAAPPVRPSRAPRATGLRTAYVRRRLEYGPAKELREPPGDRVFDHVARDFHALASQLGA